MDVSDVFYFFCSREGKGESGATRRAGGRFFIENPRRGGVSEERISEEGAGRASAGKGGGG